MKSFMQSICCGVSFSPRSPSLGWPSHEYLLLFSGYHGVFWKIIFGILVQTKLSLFITIWKTLFLPFPQAHSFPRGRTVTAIVHANPYQTSSNQQLTLNKFVLFFSTPSLAVTRMSFEDCSMFFFYICNSSYQWQFLWETWSNLFPYTLRSYYKL